MRKKEVEVGDRVEGEGVGLGEGADSSPLKERKRIMSVGAQRGSEAGADPRQDLRLKG